MLGNIQHFAFACILAEETSDKNLLRQGKACALLPACRNNVGNGDRVPEMYSL